MGISTNVEYGTKFTLTIKNVKTPTRFLKKGDIVSVDFGVGIGHEKAGIRPAVILSNNSINAKSDNVMVAPLTSMKNKIGADGELRLLATHVIMSKQFYRNMDHSSIIQLEDTRSISKCRISNFIGDVSDHTMGQIEEKLSILFSL